MHRAIGAQGFRGKFLFWSLQVFFFFVLDRIITEGAVVFSSRFLRQFLEFSSLGNFCFASKVASGFHVSGVVS